MGVHCKAGLGRTGCCIAGYSIKHFRFPARWFIGWIRICRPGSILGPQQYWMLQNEDRLIKKGEEWRKSGKRIQLEDSWVKTGDKEFITKLVDGHFDTNHNLNTEKRRMEEKINTDFQKMNMRENTEIEEQGTRLVNSKTKNSPNSPESNKKLPGRN